jgi:predicted secreted protein
MQLESRYDQVRCCNDDSEEAWKTELDALAKIDNAQKNPPQGKIRMYCAGWRDKNMIGWGDYYLHSIHATPEAATAAIESLRVELPHAGSASMYYFRRTVY